jgi:hypothetical protein
MDRSHRFFMLYRHVRVCRVPWPVNGGSVSDLYLDMQSEPEFIPIDKQPDDEVMHLNRFGKTDRLTS